jgi:nitroreductase
MSTEKIILNEILRLISRAPSADNSQPWRFLCDGATLQILSPQPTTQTALFGPTSPATLIAIGGVLENFLTAADFYGFTVRTHPLTEAEHTTGIYLFAEIEPSNRPVPQEPCPVLARHTNRFPFRPDPLPDAAASLLTAAQEGPARILHFNTPNDLATLARQVAAASRIRFQTREVHEWLAHSLRYTEAEIARGDGLDIHTLHLPPGGRAFLRFIGDWRRMEILNRLGVYKAMAHIEAQLIQRSPAIAALIAPNDFDACLAAGRLLTRVWTALNQQGIAVHPYYVIPDQLQRLRDGMVPDHLTDQAQALHHDCQDFLHLAPGETLHMLLRLGYPTRNPPRSRRRPLAEVVIDQTGNLN